MRLSSTLLLCTFIVGCFYESNLPDESLVEFSEEQNLRQSIIHVDHSRMALTTIDFSDGINFEEANTILDNFYFTDKADGCGAPGNIVDKGNQWKVATFVGFSAKRSHPIYIDKKTGAIKRNNQILVANPQSLTFDDPIYYLDAKKHLEQIEGF